MKEVYQVLKDIGVPVYAQIFSPTEDTPIAATQYLTYTTTVTEGNFSDDYPHTYKLYVYLYLWSDTDPTTLAKKVRQFMRKAGFAMVEQTDEGYNRSRYDYNTSKYAILWTWQKIIDMDDWTPEEDTDGE